MGKHRDRFRVVLGLCVFFFWCLPAAPATLIVDAGGGTPYQTIQSAINSAVAGIDDVFVLCGTYAENVVMRDGVSVSGEGSRCTIIDGGQNGSVVTMVGVGAATSLQGFTISNGKAPQGGGIYLEASSPTITQNIIIGNRAESVAAYSGYGGGIFIRQTLARGNSTAPLISGNVVRENVADQFGGGLGIDVASAPTISNNIIDGNRAGQNGGAIDVFGNSEPIIVNNTIVRNCLQGGAPACVLGGGGISVADSTVDLTNNVIAWNESAVGGGVDDFGGGAILNFNNNDTFGNTPANYFGVADPTGSNGNISVDPLFVDEAKGVGGFQPRSDSPLVDGGVSLLAPPDDIRSIPRPLDGDGNATTRYDIGARENEGVTRLRFDSGSAVGWDASINGAALFNLYRGDLATLRSTGIYTQDIATVLGAARFCDLATPSYADLDSPAADQVYFYLAVVEQTAEGTLGFDGSPAMRPFTDPNRCP